MFLDTRVSFDSQDASKDRDIDPVLAHQLYKEGKLYIDVTNSTNMKTIYIPANGYEAEIRKLTTAR